MGEKYLSTVIVALIANTITLAYGLFAVVGEREGHQTSVTADFSR